MKSKEYSKAIIYRSDEPPTKELTHAYEDTIRELGTYFDLCRESYEDRHSWWPGQTRDLKKQGAAAFPWKGASDIEIHLIEERIRYLIALDMNALQRSNVVANPVQADDIAKSEIVSSFMKWMTSSGYIPRFMVEAELSANYLLERGIAITYVGWTKKSPTQKQVLTIDAIAELDPEIADMVEDSEFDSQTVAILEQLFPETSTKKANKAIKDLRKTGIAEFTIKGEEYSYPDIKTLAPDGDFYFPSWVMDPQEAPYCFWKTYMTGQQLLGMVVTEGWDENTVDYAIDKFQGVNINELERSQEGSRVNARSSLLTDSAFEAEELIEIIYGYQRLIDEEDGSEGIYCTVFHRGFNGEVVSEGKTKIKPYFKHELLNGARDYPVVVTRLNEDTKRLYDTTTIPSQLRGLQHQAKVEIDTRIDSNSLGTLPPLMHPVGNKPTDYGPGRMIPYRRKGELEYAPTPMYNPGSVEIEENLQGLADRLTGLADSPVSMQERQFKVDKFLIHWAKVVKRAYQQFQLFGPEEIAFRVTGSPEATSLIKGDSNENFDVTITFDVLTSDPEYQKQKFEAIANLFAIDTGGEIDKKAYIQAVMNSIDPMLAQTMLKPGAESQQEIMKLVTDDLAKIHAGIEVPAQASGAEVAIPLIQRYASQPDIAQQLQENESFQQRIQKYFDQYQMQITQQQNAQIGKIGTQPAQVGGVQTQGMGQ